jgi:hypothetical protein
MMSKEYVLVEATATFKMKYAVPIDDINPDDNTVDFIKYAEHLVSREKVNDICQEYMGDTITASGIVTEDALIQIYKEQFKIETTRTDKEILKLINDKWQVEQK